MSKYQNKILAVIFANASSMVFILAIRLKLYDLIGLSICLALGSINSAIYSLEN